MPMGDGPNDAGLSRHHLIAACEASLRRLASTTSTSTRCTSGTARRRSRRRCEALDTLVASGKVRYVGGSNYSGWQLMKALGVADRHGYQRFVTQQIYYSLQARDAEYELLPIGDRPGRRHPRLEPAGRRPAVGQVPPRRASRRRARAS